MMNKNHKFNNRMTIKSDNLNFCNRKKSSIRSGDTSANTLNIDK
jgi:hypothetical protein